MKDSFTPPLASLEGYNNVTDILARRAAAAPEHIAFDIPAPESESPGWTPVTTSEFQTQVSLLARHLMDQGLEPGQSVAVMSPTRYEWAVSDLAILCAGGVVVPLYETCSSAQVSTIVKDAEVAIAIGGGPEQCRRLSDAMEDPAQVWSMDDSDSHLSLKALLRTAPQTTELQLESRRRLAQPQDTATIVYTSGTTGEPKGVIITHGNLLAQVLNIAAAYTEVVREDGNTVIFLPLSHVLARGLQFICIASGMRIAHLADPAQVVPSLTVLKPTFLVVVPRILEKIQDAVAAKAHERGLGWIWDRAQGVAEQWGALQEERDFGKGSGSRASLALERRLFDALFYRRIRALLGGRVSYMLSGGAPLQPELSHFFRGLGVPIIEGYGLTETTAPLTGNLPGRIRSGTVGRPLPGCTVRISEQGEVLGRGPGVSPGYRDPAQTAAAYRNGFFHTGDLGTLDEDGYLRLTGRIKDILVTSGGKNISPAPWEAAVERADCVAYAVLVGDGKPYLTALVAVDPLKASALAGGRLVTSSAAGVDVVHDDAVVLAVRSALQKANASVARSEQAKRFAVVSADLTDPEIVTPSLKLRKGPFLELFGALADGLYSPETPAWAHEVQGTGAETPGRDNGQPGSGQPRDSRLTTSKEQS